MRPNVCVINTNGPLVQAEIRSPICQWLMQGRGSVEHKTRQNIHWKCLKIRSVFIMNAESKNILKPSRKKASEKQDKIIEITQ